MAVIKSTRRGRRGTAAGAIALCAAASLLFAVKPMSVEALQVVSGVSLAASALGAGIAGLWRAATDQGRTRIAWAYLGLASLAWGLGQVVTAIYELVLGTDVPFPSLADVGYLSAVPLFGLGLVRLAVPTKSFTSRMRAVLDGLLISTAVLLASWVSVLGPVAHASADNVLSKSVLLAYPLGDVVIVTLTVYVVLRARATGTRPGVPLLLIGPALAFFSFADSGYAFLSLTDSYTSGSVIDIGWLCGFSALLVAALMPSAQSDDVIVETRPLGMLLPYVVIVVAVIWSFSLTEIRGQGDSVTPWLRTILILLIVVRQVLALQENARLTRHLEERVADRTAELQRSEHRFRSLVEHSSDVVSLVQPSGEIVYQSDSSQRVFGLDGRSLLGKTFFELLEPESHQVLSAALLAVSAEAFSVKSVEVRMRHGDGSWRDVETTITNLLGEPTVHGLVFNSRDVSESRRLQEELVRQAFHDSLTGLANRALFNDRVSQAMKRRESGARIAVIFLDLDGFKKVNDSLGHASGDQLLNHVAARLGACVRNGDTVARLGGDEFAILLETNVSVESVTAMAKRVRHAALDPYLIDDRQLFIQGSIGIALGDGDTADAGQLIRNADLAMYQAKAQRERDFVVYDPTMHSSLIDKLELEADLRQAVHGGELQVHYQPLYSIAEEALVGVEALVRWTHATRGPIEPSLFIPLAEQSGLIHELGRFVLQEACSQGRKWLDALSGGPIHVAVNVSGRQLQRPDFADEVADALRTSGFPATSLIVEVTESVMINDEEASTRTLSLLKDMGTRVAIDDFGTGYSSLSYLHKYPVDILKIDRSFVERLSGEDPQDKLVQSIVQLGQSLQLQTIAEGIEDHDQLTALQRLGCNTAQGYHFGRPVPPEEITHLLDAMLRVDSTEPATMPAPRGANQTAHVTPS